MLCGIRTFSLWSQVSQTSTSSMMSLVSFLESQQYSAKGPFFFAVGTDFGSLSTFWRSVFNIVKDAPVFAGTIGRVGKETNVETAAISGVDSIEEGPAHCLGFRRSDNSYEECHDGRDDGPATGWASESDSMVKVNKHESVARRCHTVVDLKI